MLTLLACILLVNFSQINCANIAHSHLEPFHLDEFLKGTFKNVGWNGTWISDDSFIFKSGNGNINKVNADNLQQEVFLSAEIFINYNQSSITISPDEKYVLIRYNQKSVFRHSVIAQYTVYNIHAKEFYDIASKRHIQYACWAPVNSAIAYVENNNIYYFNEPENHLNAIQITSDGLSGIVYNGVPDWVYEEEVLGSGNAFWFSPDGRRLAFASFDDTDVKEYQYYIYGEGTNKQYPDIIKLRYPKVGTPNPVVVLKHVDLEDSDKTVKTLHNIIPKEIVSNEYILTGVTWATNGDVTAISENRVQNVAVVTRCNVIVDECKVEVSLKEDRGWLDIAPPLYNKEGTRALLLVSQKERNDYYKHIVLVETATQKAARLTHGPRVVLSILYWDEDNDLVYYSSTIAEKPSHQHTHVVNVNTLEDTCLTCWIKTPEGLCKVAVSYPSKGHSYHATVCNGPGPTVTVVENIKTGVANTWEDNLALRNQLAHKKHPIIKDIIVPLKSGFEARARLWMPPEVGEEHNVTYPMIVDVYAGPGSNKISDSFTTGIVNYFTTNRKYIYVQIDGRGSGRNGDNLMFEIYRRLGTVEIEDQIAVARYLRYHYSFINPEKIGIWGWSYGGFATIWALIKDTQNLFKFGLAVAPVSNFILYDTIYTERYMGLPTKEDNLLGYNNTDVTLHVGGLRNKSFFLIHGNADDNVHYQQAMHLAKALEREDIMFYQHSYPDENHSLRGVLPHLYHTLDSYFEQEISKGR